MLFGIPPGVGEPNLYALQTVGNGCSGRPRVCYGSTALLWNVLELAGGRQIPEQPVLKALCSRAAGLESGRPPRLPVHLPAPDAFFLSLEPPRRRHLPRLLGWSLEVFWRALSESETSRSCAELPFQSRAKSSFSELFQGEREHRDAPDLVRVRSGLY